VERCLACEAVVIRGISSGRVPAGAALYGPSNLARATIRWSSDGKIAEAIVLNQMIQSTIRGTAGDRVSPVHHGLASEAALHNHLLKWGGGASVYWQMPFPKDQFSIEVSTRLMKTSSGRTPCSAARNSATVLNSAF
jgi:hypothetical protein